MPCIFLPYFYLTFLCIQTFIILPFPLPFLFPLPYLYLPLCNCLLYGRTIDLPPAFCLPFYRTTFLPTFDYVLLPCAFLIPALVVWDSTLVRSVHYRTITCLFLPFYPLFYACYTCFADVRAYVHTGTHTAHHHCHARTWFLQFYTRFHHHQHTTYCCHCHTYHALCCYTLPTTTRFCSTCYDYVILPFDLGSMPGHLPVRYTVPLPTTTLPLPIHTLPDTVTRHCTPFCLCTLPWFVVILPPLPGFSPPAISLPACLPAGTCVLPHTGCVFTPGWMERYCYTTTGSPATCHLRTVCCWVILQCTHICHTHMPVHFTGRHTLQLAHTHTAHTFLHFAAAFCFCTAFCWLFTCFVHFCILGLSLLLVSLSAHSL